jgi:hypothetical protein
MPYEYFSGRGQAGGSADDLRGALIQTFTAQGWPVTECQVTEQGGGTFKWSLKSDGCPSDMSQTRQTRAGTIGRMVSGVFTNVVVDSVRESGCGHFPGDGATDQLGDAIGTIDTSTIMIGAGLLALVLLLKQK